MTFLVGSLLQNYTDHAPLQWLSDQEMEGLLCRWTLAIQEYDFQIEYKKGSQNGNADALSRHSVVAITYAGQPLDDMRKAQRDDPTTSMIYGTLLSKKTPTRTSMNAYPICPAYCHKLIAVYSFRQVLPPTFMRLQRLHISRPLVYALCFDVCIEWWMLYRNLCE